ncbi:MAG: ribose 5-phosphate isomerase B [Microscillaceae bacterium]|nr:ribose 5-phosphate isomerase B [Microscillaceae bacterium]
MKIALGADHAGFVYKENILRFLEELGHEVKNFGTDSEESVDYPDYVHPLATAVEHKEFELGILVCGSGNGVAITANKHQGIRAALCWQPEIAALARQHNNANVLALPARFIDQELSLEIVRIFIQTDFEGGRHARRVDKIACM